VGAHQRQEAVADDAAVVALEPEVLHGRRVAALEQELAELLEGELARLCRIASTSARIASSEWMIGSIPPEIKKVKG
jgi:hypothetical protein